jgi:hypothetical protein
MEKYKRFNEEINGDIEIQNFLDRLTTDGWKIIYYNENIKDVKTMVITVVCSKSQNLLL